MIRRRPWIRKPWWNPEASGTPIVDLPWAMGIATVPIRQGSPLPKGQGAGPLKLREILRGAPHRARAWAPGTTGNLEERITQGQGSSHTHFGPLGSTGAKRGYGRRRGRGIMGKRTGVSSAPKRPQPASTRPPISIPRDPKRAPRSPRGLTNFPFRINFSRSQGPEAGLQRPNIAKYL